MSLSKGDGFTVVYPFVRSTYTDVSTEGYPELPTWRPGVEYRQCGPEDTEAYADAEGLARFTVVDVFKPGHYPARVFYTRKFIDPDGREFGKPGLRIATLEKFRRLTSGYGSQHQDPYAVGDEPRERGRSRLAVSLEWFERELASVDTHAKRGDSTQIEAPSPMGSAVAATGGETPND